MCYSGAFFLQSCEVSYKPSKLLSMIHSMPRQLRSSDDDLDRLIKANFMPWILFKEWRRASTRHRDGVMLPLLRIFPTPIQLSPPSLKVYRTASTVSGKSLQMTFLPSRSWSQENRYNQRVISFLPFQFWHSEDEETLWLDSGGVSYMSPASICSRW